MRRAPRALSAALHGPLPGVLLAGSFVIFTLLSLQPLLGLDRLLNVAFDQSWPQAAPLVSVLGKLGQRGLVLPLLFGLALYLARRRRSWEPLVVTLVSSLALNFVVGVCKLLTARAKPVTGDPTFFEQGVLYPSGHAANAIMYFGLAVFLLRRYGNRDGAPARLLLALTWVACVSTVVNLLYFQLHWFTDIVGGLLVGGAVLRSTVYDRGVVRRLSGHVEPLARRVVRAWRRRHRPAAADAPERPHQPGDGEGEEDPRTSYAPR